MTRNQRRQYAAFKHTMRLEMMMDLLAFGSLGFAAAIIAMWIWIALPLFE